MKAGTCLDYGHPRDAAGAAYVQRALDELDLTLHALECGQSHLAGELLRAWRADLANTCTYVRCGLPWPSRPATVSTRGPAGDGYSLP